MKRKFSIVFAWFVRSLFFFVPDVPIFMRMRGFAYGMVMKSAGRNFQVAHSATLNSISELSVGSNVYIANGVSLLCGGGVQIGDNSLIGPGVVVSSDNHQFRPQDGYRFAPVKFARVEIGEGAWLCANSVVAAGARLPPFSVLAPVSVLTKGSTKDGALAGVYFGNPARMKTDEGVVS